MGKGCSELVLGGYSEERKEGRNQGKISWFTKNHGGHSNEGALQPVFLQLCSFVGKRTPHTPMGQEDTSQTGRGVYSGEKSEE